MNGKTTPSYATHTCPYRVCYADSDQMGRVYYANYFVIAERARTEFLRDAGYPYREMEAEGFFMPVRQCGARFYGPALYDDLLTLRSHIGWMRHATLSVVTAVERDGAPKPLAVVTVELACVKAADGRPRPLPDVLRERLLPFLAPPPVA